MGYQDRGESGRRRGNIRKGSRQDKQDEGQKEEEYNWLSITDDKK